MLVLLPYPSDANHARKLEQFVSTLWDIGLEVGHSVRTIDECIALAAQDITVQTNLLEARLLTGDRPLFAQFEEKFARNLDPQQFCEAKRLEQEQRHERHRATNLEPNIKETAGGLRDLHNILWIAKAAGIGGSWSDPLLLPDYERLIERGAEAPSQPPPTNSAARPAQPNG